MRRVDSQSDKQEKTKGSWIGLRWEGDDIESVELVGEKMDTPGVLRPILEARAANFPEKPKKSSKKECAVIGIYARVPVRFCLIYQGQYGTYSNSLMAIFVILFVGNLLR
ncbi:hypothetical protein B0H13DRAFT_1904642 [Mycena leptocephala]|nr:hypothetical protein B0H13DRAFT_1904642 [Mycena leptocephala]